MARAQSQRSSDYALDAKTGAKLWSYTTSVYVGSSPAVANGVVYFTAGGNVYALNAHTGAELWSYATGGASGSSPSVVDGVFYVGSGNGEMYAFGLKHGRE